MELTQEQPVDTTGQVIAALLLFTEQVKRTTPTIHTKNLSDGREIRDAEKNTLFRLPLEQKGLVKKVYSLVKESLRLCPVHAAEFVVLNSGVFCSVQDHRVLLETILQTVEGSYPRPWLVNYDHDGLFDATGNRFFDVPLPETGFRYEYLEELILTGQDSVLGLSDVKPVLGSPY